MPCANIVASPMKKIAASLRLDRRRNAGNAYYLRARILQAHLSRNQTDDSAEQQHPIADPDPRHKRENVHLKNGLGVVGRYAGEIHVQVFIQAAPDADHRRLLLAGGVNANFRVKLAYHLAVAGNVKSRVAEGVIGSVAVIHGEQLQLVMPDTGALVQTEIAGLMLVESAAGEAD